MRIIIAGAGEVGFHLAKMLSQESHDITIIDLDENRLKRAEANIDVSTLKGNAFSPRILEASNVQTADLFVAVTSSEETNIATAIVSKKMGAKHTIARIRNPEFQNKEIKESFKALGIDSMVFPEQLASREIERLIYRSELTDYFEFSGGKLTLSGIVLDKKAPLINKNLIQASKIIKDLKFVVVAIQRGSQTLIPRGDTRFQPRDHIYVIAHKEKLNDIIYLAGQVHTNIRNIMILGGGRIGRLLAKRIQHKFNVKLIEKVQDRCFGIADELVKTLVIHGDGSDVELLVDENVDGMDAFIAVTGDSENKHHIMSRSQKPWSQSINSISREHRLHKPLSKHGGRYAHQQKTHRGKQHL